MPRGDRQSQRASHPRWNSGVISVIGPAIGCSRGGFVPSPAGPHLGQCLKSVSVAPRALDEDQRMQSMTLDLPRRGFMTGLCGVAVGIALTPATAIADGD